MTLPEQSDLLRRAVDDFKTRRCWGEIKLSFRAGEIEVVTKTETLKGTTQLHERQSR
jgi:hypothetical protein